MIRRAHALIVITGAGLGVAVAAALASGFVGPPASSRTGAVAATSPVPATASTLRLPAGTAWITDAAFDADGSARLLDFNTPPAVISIAADGTTSAPVPLRPGKEDSVEKAVLTPHGATLVYMPDPKQRRLVARDVSRTGEVREQVLGSASSPLALPVDLLSDVQGGIAAVPISGRSGTRLVYRAADAASFSAPEKLGTTDDSYRASFAADGSAVLIAQSQYAVPATFQRVGRDGRLGSKVHLGKRLGTDMFFWDTAISARGDFTVAEVEPASRTSQRGVLRVATMPASANRFGRVRKVDEFPLDGDGRLALGTDPAGTLTVLVANFGKLRVYRGTPTSLRKVKTIDAPATDDLEVVSTDDGHTVALWSARSGPRFTRRELRCSAWRPSGWSKPASLASGRAVDRDEDDGGSDPGLYLQVAEPWPGGGIGVVYRVSGKASPTYVRRVLASDC